MAGKKVSFGPGVVACTPAPKSGVVVCAGSKSGRYRTESFEVEKTTKTVCRKHGGGGSSKVTQSCKAGEFVDKGNGNKVFKEEVKCKSAVKVVDKVKGRTTEYQAEIKIKKVTIHSSDNSSRKARAAAAPKPSATSKRIN